MPLKIAMTGSSGLIGTAVISRLAEAGHRVTRILRPSSKSASDAFSARWDIARNQMDPEILEGHVAVIHLAGTGIAKGRWSPTYKEEIRSSRIKGTQLLCKTLTQLKRPPSLLLSASAIGYYGSHPPDHQIEEGHPAGNDFLARLCVEWEKATEPAEKMGIRVVPMRFGVVLSKKGGALAKMLPVFRMGLGGRIGSGQQMMSWIALEEIASIILHLLNQKGMKGPVNLVSPQPVSNAALTRILGEVLKKPTFLPVPGLALKLAFGEMAKVLLLEGASVFPRRLKESGYVFQYEDLKKSLEVILRA